MLSNNYLPREEKYPNISQEEFIPIEYIHPSGVTTVSYTHLTLPTKLEV